MCLPTIVKCGGEYMSFPTFGEAVVHAEKVASEHFDAVVYIPVRKVTAEKITKVEFISGNEEFTKGIYNQEGEKIV